MEKKKTHPSLSRAAFPFVCVCESSGVVSQGERPLLSVALEQETQAISQSCYLARNSDLLSEN